MTTLYRPTAVLTPEDRKVPGILITQYPRAMYLVPIEAVEEKREHPTRVEERAGYAYRQPVQQVRYKTRWEDA